MRATKCNLNTLIHPSTGTIFFITQMRGAHLSCDVCYAADGRDLMMRATFWFVYNTQTHTHGIKSGRTDVVVIVNRRPTPIGYCFFFHLSVLCAENAAYMTLSRIIGKWRERSLFANENNKQHTHTHENDAAAECSITQFVLHIYYMLSQLSHIYRHIKYGNMR